MPSRRWAITGASGYVGEQLAERLIARGERPALLSRRPMRREGGDVVTGDVRQSEAVTTLVAGAEVVVHAAAFVHRAARTVADRDECRSVNIEGTRVLVEAAVKAGVKVLVFISSANVYGRSAFPLTELDPCGPITPYGLSKLEAERIVESVDSATTRCVILRPAAVIGHGAPGNFDRLVRLVRSGFLPLVGGNAVMKSLLPIENFLNAIEAVVEGEHVRGVFNVTGGEPLTLQEIGLLIGEGLERRPRLVRVPRPLFKGAALVGDAISSIVLPEYAGSLSQAAETLMASSVLSESKLVAASQYRRSISVPTAIREVARGMRPSANRQQPEIGTADRVLTGGGISGPERGSSPTRGLALVTGATGAVGARLVEALSGEWSVRSLVREGGESLPGEAARGDLSDLASLERACAGVDTVFHLAALLHIVNPGSDLESEYTRVNVEGTRNLVRAAESAGVRRFVHFSTIAVYGPSGTTIDEATSTDPDTIYARTKLESEGIVLQSAIPEPVILRLAAVYGSRQKGNYRRLVRSLSAGRFVEIGKGANRRTLVHEVDVARAAMLAATHEAAPHQIFNVTDGAMHEVSSILEAISAALGRRPPRIQIPPSFVRRGLSMVSAGQRLFGVKPTLGPWLLEKYLEDVRVSGDKIQRALGYAPSVSLEEGWSETVDGMRARGELPARCSFLARIGSPQ